MLILLFPAQRNHDAGSNNLAVTRLVHVVVITVPNSLFPRFQTKLIVGIARENYVRKIRECAAAV